MTQSSSQTLTQAQAVALMYIGEQPDVVGANKKFDDGSMKVMSLDMIAGHPFGVCCKTYPFSDTEQRAPKASLKAKHCGHFAS